MSRGSAIVVSLVIMLVGRLMHATVCTLYTLVYTAKEASGAAIHS